MKNILTNKFNLIILAAIDIIIIVSIVFLMNYVQYLINSDVRINLSEIVTQNKNVITSKLSMELNSMELEAKLLSEKLIAGKDKTRAELNEIFYQFTKQQNDSTLVYAQTDGLAISASGKEFDISGRAYFLLGKKGTPTISERIISRENGEDVFVFCVPLKSNNEIIGTIQKQYTPSEMYSLCSVSLFSDEGSTYIINSEGYILISSENSEYTLESSNYYRQVLYPTDPSAAKLLEKDIRANRSGFMNAEINGHTTFFAYTPIDQIYNWYLISAIPTSAISPNSQIIIKIYYGILFTAAVMFSVSLLYFMFLKNKQQKDLEEIAFVDNITGGVSFTKFTLELEKAVYQQTVWPLYICAFDIDNFKYINAFYSYEAGDVILKSIYEKYKERLLPGEMLTRMSADKFVLMLIDASPQRMERLIECEIIIDGIKIYISAGIYRIPEEPQSVNLMIDKAYMAANKVKGIHFKAVDFYSDELDLENARNEQLKRAMELALENNEIVPFFQPKVDIYTRALVGAEALARWITADNRIVSPAEFIPVCEKTGLISIVDMVIFEKTLQFISSNLQRNIKCVPISVNFSRLHLLNAEFVDVILKKLDEYGVPHELIELELTETVIFENLQTIADFIDTIHKHGLRISMDDFGSGYSSLHMLKDTDIDVLKIDRGFLLDTTSDARQKIIFGAIVQMAKTLKIDVIVEGVETEENVKLLKEFGCCNAQGFYYSKPLNLDTFEKIYTEGHL